MLNAAEIARGIQGALALLKRDPASPSYFHNTLEACVRYLAWDMGPKKITVNAISAE